MNQKLELWRETLEFKGFRLSRTKTKYMRCDFSTTTREEKDISLKGQVVPRRIPFDIYDQCYREMGILMKMLAIESKQGG